MGVLTSRLSPQVGNFAFLQVNNANAPPFPRVGGGGGGGGGLWVCTDYLQYINISYFIALARPLPLTIGNFYFVYLFFLQFELLVCLVTYRDFQQISLKDP